MLKSKLKCFNLYNKNGFKGGLFYLINYTRATYVVATEQDLKYA